METNGKKELQKEMIDVKGIKQQILKNDEIILPINCYGILYILLTKDLIINFIEIPSHRKSI